MKNQYQDMIIALATPSGSGAIAVIRLSGKGVIEKVNQFFESKYHKNKDLTKVHSHTIHLGYLKNDSKIIDEVLVSIFKNPHSYTGEDVVEISIHGSTYVQQQVLQLFLTNGVRLAQAGEFTLRAFLNGKMDLSQAEAVADLIASDSETSHQLALQQMRGGFSNEIKKLRTELIHFASLIELELDFSEEDVEFVDRTQFKELVMRIEKTLRYLIDSFAVGNVIKEGIPVAIVGKPNVGKSTLLNALLNEERAIVSNIAGTTRDVIEDELVLDGIRFRFIDTAGIREAKDEIEKIGIQKTYEKIKEAKVVVFLIDACFLSDNNPYSETDQKKNIQQYESEIRDIHQKYPDKKIVVVVNKMDKIKNKAYQLNTLDFPLIEISAKHKKGLKQLTDELTSMVNKNLLAQNEVVVSNARHYQALVEALNSIVNVRQALEANISTDLLTIDIRAALHSLGEITGEITTDDLLDNIFKNFCIGK